MVNDFIKAALPWIFIGLLVAMSCFLMSKKKDQSLIGKAGKALVCSLSSCSLCDSASKHICRICILGISFGHVKIVRIVILYILFQAKWAFHLAFYFGKNRPMEFSPALCVFHDAIFLHNFSFPSYDRQMRGEREA